jgi:hypothetical protein
MGETLLGRSRELAALVALLDDASAGRGRAAVVMGDAGIGKTRLVEALADTARDAGFAVAWGRCPDSEMPPYWPWTQALGRLLGPGTGAAPGAAPTVSDSSGLLGGEPPGGRAGLFAAVVDALDGAAAARPALIVLEDGHWADTPSLALLQFVVGALPGIAVLVVVTARDDPLEWSEDVSAGLADLPPSVLRLPLNGLDQAATGALVERIVGAGTTTQRLVAEIHGRTGGNPFFVTEVSRLHMLRGARQAIDVPPGIRQVLSRRLARLTQPASELLGAAAVVGEPDVEVLSALTGQADETVLALLDEAARARLVAVGDGEFRFVHALVREALYEELSPTVRARLHRRAAEVLGDANPADLATHWARAGGGEGRRKAAAFALQAAEQAMARMGFEQAVRLYRWALDGGAGDRITVTRALGEAQVLAGELRAGRETLRQAADLARTAGRPEDLARAVLAMGTGVGGFEVDLSDAAQGGLLEVALDALPGGDSALRAAVLARISLARAGRATPEERAAQARSAVEMARRLDDEGMEVAALAALCDALAGPDQVAERERAADRMVKLGETVGDPLLLLLARRFRLVARLERGDLPGVDAEIAAYARTAERLRLPLYSWPLPIWRGMRALLDDDVDTAWRCSEEAEELGRQADSANAEMMVWTLQLATAKARGTIAEMVPRIERWTSSLDQYPGWDCSFAAVFAAAGRPDEARHHLRRVLAAGVEAIGKDSEFLELAWQLGDAAIALDEPDAARMAYEALAPYPQLWAVDGIGGACFGPVAAQLARLAAYLGRPRRELPHEAEEGEFRRDGKLWHVRFRGATAIVPDSKGMGDLAVLLSRPGREVHVLDLLEAAGGPSAPAASGDTGPVLDARARAAYTARLVELEDDIAAAETADDRGRAERLRGERDFIAAELGAALGLAGRARMGGGGVERARKAVTMRISTALKAIDVAHPALARHLRLAVATGRFCAYRPERPTVWTT